MHPKVYKMAAGNLKTDGAIVNDLSTAMQSRMVHFGLELDVDAWVDHAHAANFDFRVIAYINYKNEMLQNFKPDHGDRTFPCPRTWEFVSDLIQGENVLERSKHQAMLCGTVGQAAGLEFFGFCGIFQKLPTIEQIINNPMGFALPTEPAVKYAISGLLANNFTEKNATAIVQATERLDVEFQIITLQSVIKNNRSLISNPEVNKWVMKNAKFLL